MSSTRRYSGVRSDSGIVRFKLWNRQHWLVYSDKQELRGRWFPSTDLLDESLDGRFGSEITDLTAPEEREEQDFGPLLVLYVPLRDDASGEVIGAFEVYLPWSPVAAAIAEDSRDLYLALGAGLLVLYAALYRLVASASRRLQRQTEENLRQATHDGLTGLPNRGLFTDRLENALAIAGRQGNGLAVVLLDLDGFKEINDALGHASGDEILCELAQRLQHRLRAGDTVARLGGDEFGFLLPTVATDADAVAVAADLQDLLDEPFMVNGMAVHLAASFGVACYPDHGLDAGELVRHADVARYAAKATNTVIEVYAPQFDLHSAERLELAAEVRRALDEDELELWYQPKMDLIDGHIVGVEALLRWNHPTRGIVAPGLFMPVVETTELVRTVTAFVLREAVAQCARWKLDGRDLIVAVNLPARIAHDLRLPGQVADLLARHHLPASALECELTESAVLDHPDRARQVLSELDRLGVHLSIDDFGTGYASVAYLTDLPIHALKIDQSFVRRRARRRGRGRHRALQHRPGPEARPAGGRRGGRDPRGPGRRRRPGLRHGPGLPADQADPGRRSRGVAGRLRPADPDPSSRGGPGMSRPTSWRSALAPLGLAAVAGLLSTSCGSDAPAAAETPDPVFALDRDVTDSIEVPDPDRTDVAPAPDLRILLQTLLAEHSELAIQTMRSIIDETPDLDALREAITVNTDALTEAIGLVYGPSGARAFDQLWTQHIEFFAAYAGCARGRRRRRGDRSPRPARGLRARLLFVLVDRNRWHGAGGGGGGPAP